MAALSTIHDVTGRSRVKVIYQLDIYGVFIVYISIGQWHLRENVVECFFFDTDQNPGPWPQDPDRCR
jgi:hypothetical protein